MATLTSPVERASVIFPGNVVKSICIANGKSAGAIVEDSQGISDVMNAKLCIWNYTFRRRGRKAATLFRFRSTASIKEIQFLEY